MNEKLYRFTRRLLVVLFALLFPIRKSGAEHIPLEGAVMLCGNHVSLRDPALLACCTKRPIHFLAKKELFGKKWSNRLVRALGAYPVARGNSDLGAMRACMGVLQAGEVLGIFPQGHRYKDDANRDVETGAAMIALRSRATVIPVQITPPYRLFRGEQVRFGAPVKLDDLYGHIDAKAMEETAVRLRCAIWGESRRRARQNVKRPTK